MGLRSDRVVGRARRPRRSYNLTIGRGAGRCGEPERARANRGRGANRADPDAAPPVARRPKVEPAVLVEDDARKNRWRGFCDERESLRRVPSPDDAHTERLPVEEWRRPIPAHHRALAGSRPITVAEWGPEVLDRRVARRRGAAPPPAAPSERRLKLLRLGTRRRGGRRVGIEEVQRPYRETAARPRAARRRRAPSSRARRCCRRRRCRPPCRSDGRPETRAETGTRCVALSPGSRADRSVRSRTSGATAPARRGRRRLDAPSANSPTRPATSSHRGTGALAAEDVNFEGRVDSAEAPSRLAVAIALALEAQARARSARRRSMPSAAVSMRASLADRRAITSARRHREREAREGTPMWRRSGAAVKSAGAQSRSSSVIRRASGGGRARRYGRKGGAETRPTTA